MKHKKKDFEIKFYEGLLDKRPNFFHALASLGDAYTRKGFYQEGLEVDRKLVRLKPQDPTVHYNLACSLSLVGEIDQAFEELKRAVLLGYDDFEHIKKDPDLSRLQQHHQFDQFLEKINRIDQK